MNEIEELEKLRKLKRLRELEAKESGTEIISSEEFTGKSKSRRFLEDSYKALSDAVPFLPSQKRAEAFITPEKGASPLVRAGMTFKSSAADRANYLKELYGPENVRYDQVYGLQVNEPGKGWVKIDPDTANISDIAEAPANTIRYGIPIAAGFHPAGRTATGQGLASGLATLLTKGIGAALPGGSSQPLKDFIVDPAADAAMSATITKGIDLFGRGVVKGPHNYLANRYQKAAADQGSVAKLGKHLSERTRIPLTIGEETQDPILIGLQEQAQKSFFGKKWAMKMYNRQLSDSIKYMDDAVKTLDADPALTKIGRGKLFMDMTSKAFDNAYEARRLQATTDYSFAKGNKTAVSTDNLKAAVDEIFDTYSGLRTAAKKGESILADIADSPMNVSKAVDKLSILSKIERGKGTVYTGLRRDQDSHIAGLLSEAIEKDLIETEKRWTQSVTGTQASGVIEKLKQANANYRLNSDHIRSLQGTVFGKLMKTDNPTPELFVDALRKAQPSQIEPLILIAQKHSPEFMGAARTAVVDDIIEAGKKGAYHMPPWVKSNISPIDAGAQANQWNEKTINKLFQDNKQKMAVMDIARIARRFGRSPILSGGQQATQFPQEAVKVAASGQKELWGPPFFLKWFVGPVMGKAMLNPEGQAAIRTMATTSPSSQQIARATAYLTKAYAESISEQKTGEALGQ